MDVVFTKGWSKDRLEFERPDGSRCGFSVPHKGPLPHDAVHVFVERRLGLTRGFWGLVSAGSDPEQVSAMAAAGGHASAKRAGVPDDGIVQLLQAERLVECFEAEHWSGGADDAGILDMATASWSASHVAPIAFADSDIAAIRNAIREFASRWSALATGGAITLDWPDATR